METLKYLCCTYSTIAILPFLGIHTVGSHPSINVTNVKSYPLKGLTAKSPARNGIKITVVCPPWHWTWQCGVKLDLQ
uniref:Uncharacterized protein n=1 Tax=Oryza brachyantha TaxID=4533 RepID=J3LWG9_ORYBR